MKNKILVAGIALLLSGPVLADDLVLDSAVGGAVGGALGGAVGAVVGGRDGAIIGAGVGAATGTAVNTSGHVDDSHREYDRLEDDSRHHHSGKFCPPGQAKKGRC